METVDGFWRFFFYGKRTHAKQLEDVAVWFPLLNRFYRFEVFVNFFGFKPSIKLQVGERVLASLATGCEPNRKNMGVAQPGVLRCTALG